ncbi:MAG: PAS domain S-box protein [Spirochaetales bacterium]|nr:MAG: PAS domain S-box protein [Spirochaetales bacterium]
MDGLSIVFLSDNEIRFEKFRSLCSVRRLSYALSRYPGLENLQAILSRDEPDLILADYWLEGGTILDLLKLTGSTPVVLLADMGSEEHIVQAVNMGAADFIIKDEEEKYLSLLPVTIRKILRSTEIQATSEDIIHMSEKRYEQLVQAIPDIVYKLDPNGYFQFVNAAIKVLGFHPEEIIGRHFTELVYADEGTDFGRKQALVKLKGKVTGDAGAPKLFDERRCGERKTNGLEIFIADNKKARSQENPVIGSIIAYGEVSATGHYRQKLGERFFTGTVGIIRNISDRRKSEEMIRKLYQTVDQLPLSLLIINAENIIEYANPHFFRTRLTRPELILGKNVYELATDFYTDPVYRQIQKTLSTGTPWQGNMMINLGNGAGEYSANLTISPIYNTVCVISHVVIIDQETKQP